MRDKKGFTIIELVIVIIIISVLAAVVTPLMHGKVDKSKWSEANNCAGSIKTAVRAYISENGSGYDYSGIVGSLSTKTIYTELGFSESDLDGRYFNQEDYTITQVAKDPPSCIVTVKSSVSDGPSGTGTLNSDGTWSVSSK